jgi:hypothetical protein
MAQKPGESKQGLIITLVITWVFFVIPLGVMTYFGFADKQIEVDAKKKAVDEKNNIAEDRDYWQAVALISRGEIGQNLSKEDQDALIAKRGDWDSDKLGKSAKNKADVKKAIDDFDNNPNLGWDKDKKQPKTSYLAYIDSLEKRLAAMKKDLDGGQIALKDMTDQLDKEKKDHLKSKADFAKLINESKTGATTDLDKYVKKIAELQKQYDELSAAKEELTKAVEGEKKKYLDQIAKMTTDMKKLTQNLDEKERQVAQLTQVDQFAKDQPKGAILSIDKSGMPLIDLGSADNVRTSLTFNVIGTGPDGLPSKERKATIEVVTVLAEHRAIARVTSLRDGDRDPVMPGDKLYNIAWSPSLKQHIAIAGIVDLSGEGAGNSPEAQMRQLREFMRNLKSQNIEIDAYIDMKTLKIEGALTRSTDFLVLGLEPEMNAGIFKDTADSKNDRGSKIRALYAELEKTAKDNAVSLVDYKKFLVATGYKLPKPIAREGASYNARSLAPSVAAPAEDKKPK